MREIKYMTVEVEVRRSPYPDRGDWWVKFKGQAAGWYMTTAELEMAQSKESK